jgi:hypothetical protein
VGLILFCSCLPIGHVLSNYGYNLTIAQLVERRAVVCARRIKSGRLDFIFCFFLHIIFSRPSKVEAVYLPFVLFDPCRCICCHMSSVTYIAEFRIHKSVF